MRKPRQAARREPRSQGAPVRRVGRPKPTGGTRPLGIATVDDRVGQTALKLVLEPICEADFHDGADGHRPTRDAKQASVAMRDDRYHRAWGVVESDCTPYCTSMPHRKLGRRMTRRIADGSLRKLLQQPLRGGGPDQGQGGPTQGGVPHGSPLSPLSSHLSLPLMAHLWHRRGAPERRGATLPRYADAAMLGGRSSPPPGLAALEASAKRRDGPLNRDQPHGTRVPEGGEFLGFTCVTRPRPRRGTNTRSRFPAQSAHQQMRSRLP